MDFPVVDPTPVGEADVTGMVRIATDRPCGYDLGPSSMADIQLLAAKALCVVDRVVLVEVKRPRFNDVVYDLYVEEGG